MPTHAETRVMPYSAEQMYALVADVERYAEFLPWVAAARVTGRRPLDAGADMGSGAGMDAGVEPEAGEVLEAELVVSFKLFRERFGSRVTLRPEARAIDVEYLRGPFRYLKNHWKFEPAGERACEVDFFVDFEFRSALLQRVIGVVFNEAMQRIVRAFERRAAVLYGPPAG